MVKFEAQTGNKFLDALGIPYGHLTISEDEAYTIVCREQPRETFKRLIDEGDLTPDEAGVLETQMGEAGLLPDWKSVFQKVMDFPVPDGYVSNFNFVLCNCGNPLVHGNVVATGGNIVNGRAIFTKVAGFNVCFAGVSGGHVGPETGAYLFRQMMDADLGFDEAELIARTETLPEEALLRLAEGLGGSRIRSIGGVTVIEL